MLKGELRFDCEAEGEEDRRLSEEDRTGGNMPEFDELGTDCDGKVEMKSGIAGTWIVGIFLYDQMAQMFPSMDSKF